MKKKGFFWCVALSAGLVLLFTGCAWGVVTDAQTGAGIEGASVTWVDSTGAEGAMVTGHAGLYRFDATLGDRIPARGIATFMVLAPGYQTLVTQRDVEYDDSTVNFWETQNFALSRLVTATPPPAITVTPMPTLTPMPTAIPLMQPHHFSGSVSHRGSPTPAGIPVHAFIGGQLCGVTTTGSGYYDVLVPSSDQQPGCGYPGATVRFEVGAGPDIYQAGSYTPWTSGGSTTFDLHPVFPSDPNVFYGHARGSLDHQPVPNGVPVRAEVEGTVCAQTTISGGDGSYQLEVPSRVVQAGCGYPGATVEFYAGAGPVNRHAGSHSWTGGESTPFDLWVEP
jgi:hypothetical protein